MVEKTGVYDSFLCETVSFLKVQAAVNKKAQLLLTNLCNASASRSLSKKSKASFCLKV